MPIFYLSLLVMFLLVGLAYSIMGVLGACEVVILLAILVHNIFFVW